MCCVCVCVCVCVCACVARRAARGPSAALAALASTDLASYVTDVASVGVGVGAGGDAPTGWAVVVEQFVVGAAVAGGAVAGVAGGEVVA